MLTEVETKQVPQGRCPDIQVYLPDFYLVLALDTDRPLESARVLQTPVVSAVGAVIRERRGLVASSLRASDDVFLAADRSVVRNLLVVLPEPRSLVVGAGAAECHESSRVAGVCRAFVPAGEKGFDRGRVRANDSDDLERISSAYS